MKIWFGYKYTCDGWENHNDGNLRFIPDKVIGNSVSGFLHTSRGRESTLYSLNTFTTIDTEWRLRPLNKIVKSTALARKMYKGMVLSEKDGFLEVGRE